MLIKQTDKSTKNIWRYANLYSPFIEERYRLTLGEGGSRLMEIPGINAELSTHGAKRRIIFKREDENPAGSHKARALAYQVSYYRSKQHKTLLISSSGNAAIAAAKYCAHAGITLISFIDEKTNKAKLNEILKTGQPVIFCTKPINFAKYAARIFDIPNLRPSHDDLSIEPYKSIAFEIFEELGESVDAVFVFPTSASSLIGIAKGFIQLTDSLHEMKKPPKVIAVQTGEITSIAKEFAGETGAATKEAQVAGALGVKTTRRTNEAVETIRRVGGSGVIVSADEIRRADDILRSHGITTSIEGAANFAGVIRMGDIKNAVCLLTGRDYPETVETVDGNTFHAESYTDIKNIVEKIKL